MVCNEGILKIGDRNEKSSWREKERERKDCKRDGEKGKGKERYMQILSMGRR